MTWVLILMLVGADGAPVQVESVAVPFSTYDACNMAGVKARAFLPVLSPPGGRGYERVDWVCVQTGSPQPAHSDKAAARERLREEFRRASRGSQ